MEEEIILFEPQGKGDLRVDYPELGEVEEFASLNNKDMSFVWYWANKTSPYYHIKNKMEKVRHCIKKAYGDKYLSEKDRNNYYSMKFPPKVQVAIETMSQYNPSIRDRAKTIVEKIFDNFEEIASISVDEIKAMETDEKEDYVGLAQKVIDKMPSLVGQIEGGFGVKKRFSGKKDEGGKRIMDVLYEED